VSGAVSPNQSGRTLAALTRPFRLLPEPPRRQKAVPAQKSLGVPVHRPEGLLNQT
jgi:hypothetical protein